MVRQPYPRSRRLALCSLATASALLLAVTSGCNSTTQSPGQDNVIPETDEDDDDDSSADPKTDDDDDNDDNDDNDDDNASQDPNDGDIDDTTKPGCKGIDFLVVVDNSGSMADEQSNLSNSFPKFLGTLQNNLSETAKDFHVMVVNTGADPLCAELCKAFPSGSCITPSGSIPCSQFDVACEFGLGGGRRFNGAGQDCGITGEQRYIDSTTQTDLQNAFSCLGQQGTAGDGAEKPMEAMQLALSEEMSKAGGCNEGFLRDDAITVIMVISDEEDDHPSDTGENPDGSPGDPDDWYKAVMAVRPDAEKSIMAIGLIGDTDLPDAQCDPFDDNMLQGAEAAPRLRSFFEKFGDMGAYGSVCAPDYTLFLEDLIGRIDQNCDEFIPPD